MNTQPATHPPIIVLGFATRYYKSVCGLVDGIIMVFEGMVRNVSWTPWKIPGFKDNSRNARVLFDDCGPTFGCNSEFDRD